MLNKRAKFTGIKRSIFTATTAALLLSSINPMTSAAQEQQSPIKTVLEEVVVTATKRETSLQDTPMSITALDELEIQRLGAEYMIDYALKVPNLGLSYANHGRFAAGAPAIRGVAGGGVTGVTGVYIDDVPVPDYANPRVSDVVRIEVLRGPQGTLYGGRSMGGTIRIITKQANADELDGYLHSSISDVKEGGTNWLVSGGINMPMIKGVLGGRAVVYYAQNSGIFDRQYIQGSTRPAFEARKNIDDESYYGGQLAFVWNVTDKITIKPRYMYQRVESDNMSLADYSPDNFTVRRHNDIDEPGFVEWWLGSVTINIDTSFGQIVSTTAKFHQSLEESEDQTGALDGLLFEANGFAEPHIPSLQRGFREDSTLMHETRLISGFGDLFIDDLALTIGIFYEDRENTLGFPASFAPGINAAFTADLNAPPISAGIPLPPGALGTDLVNYGATKTDTEEIAVYSELTWKVVDGLRLTGGLRWSKTKLDVNGVMGGFVVGADQVLTLPSAKKESRLTPKVLVEYDVSDDLLLYGSATQGFRVGGVNFPVSELLCGAELAELGVTNKDLLTYESDSLWSYELGMKSSWFGNRLTLNTAVFHIDWKDVLQENGLACGFSFVANAGKAESQGLEIELQAVPIDGLSVSIGLGLTNAEILEGSPLTGLSKGDRVQQVPKVTFNMAGEYTFPLISQWDGYIRADFAHYGNSLSSNNDAVTPRVRPAFDILDIRLGAIQYENNVDVSLFIKNATNEHANLSDAHSYAAEKPGRPRLLTNRPRTVGLELRKSF